MNHKIENLKKALESLEEAINLPIKKQRDLAGIIQNFEFVFELSWKVLKNYLLTQGVEANTPREAFSKAYQTKIIEDEKVWLNILKDRNLSVHTYSEELAKDLADRIVNVYYDEFKVLFEKIVPE